MSADRERTGAGSKLIWWWFGLTSVALVLLILASLRTGSWPGREPDRTVDALPVLGEAPELGLVHHDGTVIERRDLAGQPWVVDFIFTRCPAICPQMTAEMASLAGRLADLPVRFVSISVDPEHDRPEVLRAYARKFPVQAPWYFLTGETTEVHAVIREGFRVAVAGSTPADLTHSNRFVLVDDRGRIRGYYNSFDPVDLERLEDDARLLAESSSTARESDPAAAEGNE